jgi:hypothetical protein
VPIERISFVDALRWLATAHVGDPLPELVINPLRHGRLEPRAVKRRPRAELLMDAPFTLLMGDPFTFKFMKLFFVPPKSEVDPRESESGSNQE